jgi:D-citramalate synthase
VETAITWELDHEFKTRGLDSDQTAAAIKATMRMLNLIEPKEVPIISEKENLQSL